MYGIRTHDKPNYTNNYINMHIIYKLHIIIYSIMTPNIKGANAVP